MKSLMDPIKIIVTNSDTASTASSNALYQQAPNTSDCNGSKSYQDIAQLAQNNNAPKLKSANRWNLPPLKISTSEYNTLNMQINENLDQSEEDDGKRLLLNPLMAKSFLTSQSTTSLNLGKKVTLSPASNFSRTTTNITSTYLANKCVPKCIEMF